jgi:ribosomal protein S6-L-glutamate ligase RimK-like protein
MILFSGISSERPLAIAIESAERQNIPHTVLNQRQMDYWEMSLTLGSGGPAGSLWLGEREWPLRDFSGVYARLIDPATMPENRSRRTAPRDPHARARTAFVGELLNDWLDICPGRIVNRPSAMLSNLSKPYQAQLIVKAGFLTPTTLITNDPERVREFHNSHGRIIYKSCSSVRSIVQEWNPADPNIDRIRLLPTQFQAFVPGTNIRVHVIGEAVIATEIVSTATDYRYSRRQGSDIEMRPAALPAEIEEQCRRLTVSLGLSFSGIDLKRTPQGEWYCFEVNPSPGYSFFEDHTGQAIADTLVRYLAGEEARCR